MSEAVDDTTWDEMLDALTRKDTEIVKLQADLAEAKRSAIYWKADQVSRARLMVKLRDNLIETVRELEDEGGRVYFGNTNHADDLREVVKKLDDLQWETIVHDAGERDLLADLAALRLKLAHVEGDNKFLHERRGQLVIARDNLADALKSAAAWITVWTKDVECNCKPTPESLSAAAAEIAAILRATA